MAVGVEGRLSDVVVTAAWCEGRGDNEWDDAYY